MFWGGLRQFDYPDLPGSAKDSVIRTLTMERLQGEFLELSKVEQASSTEAESLSCCLFGQNYKEAGRDNINLQPIPEYNLQTDLHFNGSSLKNPYCPA